MTHSTFRKMLAVSATALILALTVSSGVSAQQGTPKVGSLCTHCSLRSVAPPAQTTLPVVAFFVHLWKAALHQLHLGG